MIDDSSASNPGEDSSEKESLNNNNYVAETKAKIQHSLSMNNEEKIAPLATKWTFWLDSQKTKFSSKEDYEAGLATIYSVTTVQEFWSVFNNIPVPSRLANRVTYHLMRENRKPLWEDKENENGGIYTHRCSKDKTDLVWQELCLAAIGEQFPVVSNDDDIVGISVQSRDIQSDIIQIWNCDPSEKAQKAIEEKMLRLFPDLIFPVKFYKPNSSHMNFEAKSSSQQK